MTRDRFIVIFLVVGLLTPFLSAGIALLHYTPLHHDSAFRALSSVSVSILSPGIYLGVNGLPRLVLALVANGLFYAGIGALIWQGVYGNRAFLIIPVVIGIVLAILGLAFPEF